jgi:GNAT superfamily N-acetyltransferase
VPIRKLEDDDVPALADLVREVMPGWVVSEAGLRHRLRSTPERASRRDWVAEDDSEVAAWASAALNVVTERDDVAELRVLVRRDRRRRGLGSSLLALAEEHARRLGARRLLSGGPDDADARRFAEAHGYRVTARETLSRLDVASVDPSELANLRETLAGEGFAVAPFAAFADRPELLHAVDAEASLDEPTEQPTNDLRLDEWIARNWEDPDLSREGSFAVTHAGTPVAIAELIVDERGGRARNGFTGTLRAYRGRGLARFAKLAVIGWAATHGLRSLVTENDETNAPMLAVNARLGYRPIGSLLAYVRELPE